MSDKNNVLPNNLDAEQALLGCMLIDNQILSDVLEKLSEDDFYQESHRFILSAMKLVYLEHKPLDLVTLADKLETEGNLEKSGGLNYLTELAQVTPSSANYSHYFDIVRRDAINRKLIRASRDIIKFAQSSDDNLKSVQYAEELVYDISKTNDSSSVKDIRESDGIDMVLQKFQLLSDNKDAFRGVQTGLIKLDRLTNGLQKSDLIVIAARPGMGKTSLAMNIVENAALNNDKVCAVFSLEMPEVQIIQRLMCGFAGVSMSSALAGKLESNDWKKLTKASEKMRKSRIYIDDSSRVTPAEILSKCRRIKSKNNGQLDLIMIDYIQLMSSGKKNAEQNRTQEVADITRELKIMAKELDVPVIALSQLRRMQSKEPQLSDLRESGAIEQDADIVMFINRPDVGATDEELKKGNIIKGMADLIVAKHRNGGLDRIKLRFKGELTKFVNPEPGDGIEEPVYDKAPPPEYVPPAEETDGSVTFADDNPPF
ncbi:MAG: replicative DNA helicase [Clostridiales bacterium]|nr:replicative DNA helicase [Clostridiales bacterium]